MTSHTVVILFYKYFIPAQCPSILGKYPNYYVEKLQEFQRELCSRLGLKGRILLSIEGVNGTLSAPNKEILQSYISRMEKFDLINDCGLPSEENLLDKNPKRDDDIDDHDDDDEEEMKKRRLFRNVDWKESTIDDDEIIQPFPDLKISAVKEIVSTGGLVPAEEITKNGGRHLTPEEFHETLTQAKGDDVVLIDVRNTFEHDIGHFVSPSTGKAAMNPEMVAFSNFDSTFCARNAENLKDKKVLMYCTGGIRCEKASVMLKKRGVKDVNQLKGGIHRYLETYGNNGYFKGLNFVFDQRVALKPNPTETQVDIVGRCIECQMPYDTLCGSHVCTVCRDLVLICPTCQQNLREYHCRRHANWKDCYFTFLEVFNLNELQNQKDKLHSMRESMLPASAYKNLRRTLARQMDKISNHMKKLETGEIQVNRAAPRRCRTCASPSTICNGCCWGFWKTKGAAESRKRKQEDTIENGEEEEEMGREKGNDAKHETKPVAVGDVVQPADGWNVLRLGEKTDSEGKLRLGKVVQIKSWASNEKDCVVVQWNDDSAMKPGQNQSTVQPQIYRWGVIALDGTRIYDVCHP